MNNLKERQEKHKRKRSSDVTFDKDDSRSVDSKDFWDDCQNNVSVEKCKFKSTHSSPNSRNRHFSSSLPKNNGLSHHASKASNGRKVSTAKKTGNYKIPLDSQYSKTIHTVDPKEYREILNTVGSQTERERPSNKVSNGKTSNTIEVDRTSSCGKGPNKINTALNRLNQLYLQSHRKKEKINLLKEEKNYEESEKEMKECTFRPKVNKNLKFVKEEKDFLNRNEKWKSDVNNKIEKLKTKAEEKVVYDFKPAINKKPLNFDHTKKTIEDRNTIKYYERINKAKKLKEEINKKLNPNYNAIYDKMYKKETPIYEEYATFNPNKARNLDMDSIKMTLHNELNSLTIEEPNI